jgi:hypothetical protein
MAKRSCSPFANRATAHRDLSNNLLEVGYNFLDLELAAALLLSGFGLKESFSN